MCLSWCFHYVQHWSRVTMTTLILSYSTAERYMCRRAQYNRLEAFSASDHHVTRVVVHFHELKRKRRSLKRSSVLAHFTSKYCPHLDCNHHNKMAKDPRKRKAEGMQSSLLLCAHDRITFIFKETWSWLIRKGLPADGNHAPRKKMPEGIVTRAEGYESSIGDGEDSSGRQYTPPFHPNRSSVSRKHRPAAQSKTVEGDGNFRYTESQ